MDAPVIFPLSDAQAKTLFAPEPEPAEEEALWEERWTIVDPTLVVLAAELGGES